MIRPLVVLLLAANLLLIGLHVASAPPGGDRPVANLSSIPPGTPTLKLLEELAPEAYPEVATRRCYSAGPFETVPTMIQAREALGPNVEDVTERDTEALVESSYIISGEITPTLFKVEIGYDANDEAPYAVNQHEDYGTAYKNPTTPGTQPKFLLTARNAFESTIVEDIGGSIKGDS